jgi:hypothetical protein
LKDRTDFIKQIQELKSRILKGIIEVEKREKIITLLSSEDPMPIDGMTLNNFKFMNALLARDLALWPRNIGDLGNLKSENWKTFTFQANQTSDWVALQILSLPTKEARAVLYHKFCMQYRAFIDSGNFHGAAQITLGLTHPALSRLKIHEEAANEIEKNLIDIQNFITEGFGPYRVKENALKENSPYFPYGCVIGLELEQSKGNWELLQGDLKTQEDFDNRLFPVKIFSKILKKTWHLPVFPLELDDAYLKAVCSFKIHEDTPKVYSDLLDPNLSWRNLWSKLEPKNLEDWTPGYFAQKMREYECEHSIRVYFDNDVCEGTQLAKMEEKELIKWGGRHPMSREMIKFILSFPRKTQMETNHTASPRRKISDAIKPIRERPRNVEGALKQKKSTSRKGKEQNIQETVENKTSAKILMDENVNEVVTTTLHNKEIPILKVDNTGL